MKKINYLGQTPTHLATACPMVLGILLDDPDQSFLNHSDRDGFDPLYYTTSLSTSLCISPSIRCSECPCSLSVEALLMHDCSISLLANVDRYGTNNSFGCAFRRSTARVQEIILKHLKDRRLRLRDMAIYRGYDSDHENDLSSPKVTLIPEGQAVMNILMYFLKSSLIVPPPLCLGTWTLEHTQYGAMERYGDEESVFHYIDDPETAKVAFDLGFRCLDVVGPRRLTALFRMNINPVYQCWLIGQGARTIDLHCVKIGLELSSLLMANLGLFLQRDWTKVATSRETIQEVVTLASNLPYDNQSRCPCSLPGHEPIAMMVRCSW